MEGSMSSRLSSSELLDTPVGFIGAGQMARALARGFVEAGLLQAKQLTAHDPLPAAANEFSSLVAGARLAKNTAEVAAASQIIFLAVKPQHMTAAMEELKPVSAGKLFVSIAAGVSLARLAAGLGTKRVVRVMPNTPCLVGKGAAGYARGAGASEADGALVGKLLAAVGIAFELKEELLDAVTGLSGSGPAYVFTVIEALSDGGVRMGLPRDVASALAAQTVLGSAAMLLASNEHPAVLKDRVASPGGTTIAGLQALEDRGLRGALIAAVEAAANRSRELGTEH
jgi:pyrroline-5-carboxylate reductase